MEKLGLELGYSMCWWVPGVLLVFSCLCQPYFVCGGQLGPEITKTESV